MSNYDNDNTVSNSSYCLLFSTLYGLLKHTMFPSHSFLSNSSFFGSARVVTATTLTPTAPLDAREEAASDQTTTVHPDVKEAAALDLTTTVYVFRVME